MRKFNSGGGQNSPFSAVSGPKFAKFGGHVGELNPSRLTSFFPIVDILFHRRDMFGQSSELVPEKMVLPPPARGGSGGGVNPRESLNQIFFK